MKKRNRNILIAALSIFIVLGGFTIYGVYRLYSFFTWMSSMKPETPPEIKEARVLKSSDFLTKTEFFKLDESGMLDTIGKSMGIEDEEERQKFIHMQTAKGIYGFSDLKTIGYEVVAVGEFGAYIFELNGTPKRQAAFDLAKEKIKIGPYEQNTFESNLDNIRIVQLETNKYGFLSYGSRQGVRVSTRTDTRSGRMEKRTSIPVRSQRMRKSESSDMKKVFVCWPPPPAISITTAYRNMSSPGRRMEYARSTGRAKKSGLRLTISRRISSR